MSAVSDAAVVKYDPELWVNPGPALADALPTFSLDLVGVVASFLINRDFVRYGHEELLSLFGRASLAEMDHDDGLCAVFGWSPVKYPAMSEEYPDDLDDVLRSECPFTKGKLVGETHKLALFVTHTNGRLVSLRSIPRIFQDAHGILDKHPKRRDALKYAEFPDDATRNLGDNPRKNPGLEARASYWGLVVPRVPGSNEYDHISSQKSYVENRGGGKYKILPALDLVHFLFMQHSHTGRFPELGDGIYCADIDRRSVGPWMRVKSFDEKGLSIVKPSYSSYKRPYVAAMRILQSPTPKPKS